MQPVALGQIGGFQNPQLGNFHIQVHFFLYSGVSGAQGLDLGIGQCGLICILRRPHRRLAGHDLRDKTLLVFQRLPQVRIKSALGNVAVDPDALVPVALPDQPPLALFQVSGPPGCVQIVDGDHPVLTVGPGSHLLSGAEQYPDFSGTHFLKQGFFLGCRIGIMDKCDLVFRDSSLNQLGFQVRINGKSFCLWGRKVAENHLCQPFCRSVFVFPEDILDTKIHFAARFIRKFRVNEPLVQAQLSPIGGDLEHIILFGFYISGVDLCGPFGQLLDQFLLNLRWFGNAGPVFHFGDRQIQLVGSLNVCHFPEDGHKLRQVVEPCKAGTGTVAGALGSQLHGRDRLTKGGGPAVEGGEAQFPEPVILKIPLHGVEFYHAVTDRCSGGKYHATTSG